jgi:hypothetical protein
MTNIWQPDRKVDLLAPAVVVSAIIAIFAVVTQLLNATNAASLSTTQMLTAWLVSVGLIVLLWIAYMISSAYMNARTEEAEQALTAVAEANRQRDEALAADTAEHKTEAAQEHEQGGDGLRQGASPEEDGHAWVPPDELRQLDGTAREVTMDQVFPHGCRLDSITPNTDVFTQKPVYQCTVDDENHVHNGQATVVDILTGQKPEMEDWPRHAFVEFEKLTITPYEIDRDPIRIGYTLHADKIHLAHQAA